MYPKTMYKFEFLKKYFCCYRNNATINTENNRDSICFNDNENVNVTVTRDSHFSGSATSGSFSFL
jgi:hypothetical protein